MSVFALGLNHQTAPIDLRGRFAFPLEQLSPALKALVHQIGHAPADGGVIRAPEVALLSTCNRTELYVAAPEHDTSLVRPVADWLAAQGGVTQVPIATISTYAGGGTIVGAPALQFGISLPVATLVVNWSPLLLKFMPIMP